MVVSYRMVRKLGGQFVWSLTSKVLNMVLQVVVVVQLARALAPAQFATISTVIVVIAAIGQLNGFGLQRQIMILRAREPRSVRLDSLYSLRLTFSYVSAILWLVGCLSAWVATSNNFYIKILPCCLLLLAEQCCNIWNVVSTADEKNQDLVLSFLFRRLPVVLLLVVAGFYQLDPVWSWSVGATLGAVLAYCIGRRTQEGWAQTVFPKWPWSSARGLDLDFTFWWSSVGGQLRDLDVGALAIFSPVAAGVYAFPARLVRPMNILTQSLGMAAFPSLARRARIPGRQLVIGTLLGTLPVGVVSAAMALVAPLTPAILGTDYDSAVGAIQILCVASTLLGANMILWTYVQTRNSRAAWAGGRFILILGVGQLVAVSALGASFGASGAATGAVIIQTTMLIGFIFIARWQIRLDLSHPTEAAVSEHSRISAASSTQTVSSSEEVSP